MQRKNEAQRRINIFVEATKMYEGKRGDSEFYKKKIRDHKI